MIAQIEVFSRDEAIRLGNYLDQHGYRWNNAPQSKFQDHADWDRWLPHKYYFLGLLGNPSSILHEDKPFELEEDERYDFVGTFAEFMEVVGEPYNDENENFEIEDESELEKLLFA